MAMKSSTYLLGILFSADAHGSTTCAQRIDHDIRGMYLADARNEFAAAVQHDEQCEMRSKCEIRMNGHAVFAKILMCVVQ